MDTQFFKRTNPKLDTQFFDLVFCGKLIPLKGADIAIEVVRELHDIGYKSVRLHVIGDGFLLEQLKQQVQEYQLEDYVIFYGSLSQEDIKARFEQADVFIMPGRYDSEGRAETQGLVIQEAQAMELPVVVSDVGGMKYGLLLNESGLVIPEGKITAFSKAIESLLYNLELKTSMGIKGRRYVVEHYDTQVLANRLITIYNNVLK